MYKEGFVPPRTDNKATQPQTVHHLRKAAKSAPSSNRPAIDKEKECPGPSFKSHR